jgi:hypothetical protein
LRLGAGCQSAPVLAAHLGRPDVAEIYQGGHPDAAVLRGAVRHRLPDGNLAPVPAVADNHPDLGRAAVDSRPALDLVPVAADNHLVLDPAEMAGVDLAGRLVLAVLADVERLDPRAVFPWDWRPLAVALSAHLADRWVADEEAHQGAVPLEAAHLPVSELCQALFLLLGVEPGAAQMWAGLVSLQELKLWPPAQLVQPELQDERLPEERLLDELQMAVLQELRGAVLRELSYSLSLPELLAQPQLVSEAGKSPVLAEPPDAQASWAHFSQPRPRLLLQRGPRNACAQVPRAQRRSSWSASSFP